MRDSMRYYKRKALGLTEGFIEKLVGHSELVMGKFHEAMIVPEVPREVDTSDCTTFDHLSAVLRERSQAQESNDVID